MKYLKNLTSFKYIFWFINNKIKKYLIISGISLVVSLYLFEGYLTQILKNPILESQILREQLYENQTGNKWDTRNKLEIYKELKKNSSKVTVAPQSSFLLNKDLSIFPFSGASSLKTINCK